MKKHASGFQIGAYVAGGLVAVYLLGWTAIYIDYFVLGTKWQTKLNPHLQDVLVTIYQPLTIILRNLGVSL